MYEGKCLCGSVTWELTAEPFEAYNCHCKMCQKVHGTPFGTYYMVRPDHMRWTSSTDKVIHYRSSEHLTRASCDVCGSVVPCLSEEEDFWFVPGGGHDQGRKVGANIFVADKAAWLDLTGDVPCHDAFPPDDDSPVIENKQLPDKPEGVTRGGCLCGAVEFHVTRPFKVAYNCYCSRCRYARSAAHASNAFTSMDGVHFLKGEDHLRSFKVPGAKHFTQVFCDVCSSPMPRIDPGRGIAVVPLGSLDDVPDIRPVGSIYVADKSGWHDITDELPAYEAGPPSA